MSIDALAEPGGLSPAEPAATEDAPVASRTRSTISVRLRDGGIIEIVLPADAEIEGPDARMAGTEVRALANGRRMPVLLTITGVMRISPEARHVYSSSIAASAFALVGETPVDRVIAHYLLRSKTETIPAQFFMSEAEAIDWLGQHAREN